MQIQKIKNRGTLFTAKCDGWDYNLYLIEGAKHYFVIDTGLGFNSAAPILEQIKNDPKQTVVINTHYHWDHVWGNSSFLNCLIVSHRLCRELIRSQWEAMMQKNGRYCDGEVTMQLPNLVFEKELYFVEDQIRLFHTPGHTADSISILDEEDGVLVLADNVGDNMDELVPGLYCEKDVYKNTIKLYESLNFDTCITGHNRVLGKEMLTEILKLL